MLPSPSMILQGFKVFNPKGSPISYSAFPQQGKWVLNALPVLLAVGMKSAAASRKHHHLHLTLRTTSSEGAKLAIYSRFGL